ncbi:membrane protease regulatory membrane protein [Paenibacillus graminis]|uniref:Membrane protease regulatory membrane protein n=1 Tax=Paenibacillus graminis TaxID=189425 RepID=A0A089M667_9BACL|nr:membrane protease regulatory membrane protein [Paenibacillus graminis]AIQ67850.1 membrane protease regulatory membrane protein [Paenibacillus graminis]
METLYLGCLALGVIFAVVSVLLGDLIGSALDGIFDVVSFHFISPAVLAGGITVFGGAGILLTRYSSLDNGPILALSLLTAAFMGVVMYLGVVKPVNKSEMSSGFSMNELPGKIGEITVPVPAQGYGEIMVKFGAGNSLHTAASFDHHPLPAGIKVVVVEVEDGVALVSEFEQRRGVDA